MTDPKHLRELCAKAKLPWRTYVCSWAGEKEACGIRSASYPQDEPYGADIFQDGANDECHHMIAAADADLICNAVNSLPSLLDEIERLRAALREALDGWEGWEVDQQHSSTDLAVFDHIDELRKLAGEP